MLFRSEIDLSLITGESLPVSVTPGARVIGATINMNGSLVVRAERVGAQTELARITRMVVHAQGEKAPIARLADRIASIFVPSIIALAILTFIVWMIATGDLTNSIAPAITLLVIACPCALGLATPIAFLVASGRGAQLGIILRTPAVLEQTHKGGNQSPVLLLDKTGTVTTGKIEIVNVETFGIERSLLLAIAGTIENQSEHPVARGVVALAKSEKCNFGLISEFESHPGRGVAGRAEISGKSYLGLIGSPEAIAYGTAGYSPEILAKINEIKGRGRSPIVVSLDGIARALLEVGDEIKEDSREAIADFAELGFESVLVTGDSDRAAAHIANVAGISTYKANVLPEDKVRIVEE